MLERIELVNAANKTLALYLRDDGSGYSLEDIQGLDPVRANLVTSDIATVDGVQFQAASTDARNIIITVGMENTESTTVKKLRHELYAFFMPKTALTIRFIEDDGSLVQITGRMETFAAPLFAKNPHGVASIVCFDPAFYTPNQVKATFQTTAGVVETPVNYEGSLESGFLFEMRLTRPVQEVSIYQTDASGFIRSMEIVYPFQTGDTLQVSTVPNEKGVYLIRGGIRTSILYALASGHSWGALQPGGNTIRVAVTGLAIQYTLKWYEKFGGL